MQLLSIDNPCHCLTIFFNLWMIIALGIAVERPNVDSVVFSSCDYHAIVERVEHRLYKRIGVPNEGLIEKGHSLLGIVVPHFNEIVLASRQHVAAIVGEISRGACSPVHSGKFSQVEPFKPGQAIDSNSLIFGHNNHFTSILAELEASDDCTDLDLVLEYDRVRAVDHNVVAVLAHDCEHRLIDSHLLSWLLALTLRLHDSDVLVTLL